MRCSKQSNLIARAEVWYQLSFQAAYQQLVHLLLVTVFRSRTKLLLSVLFITTFNICQLNCFFKVIVFTKYNTTNQDGLHVIQGGPGLVHEHLLGDVFPPLCPVQFVVCVTIQGGPAQELG